MFLHHRVMISDNMLACSEFINIFSTTSSGWHTYSFCTWQIEDTTRRRKRNVLQRYYTNDMFRQSNYAASGHILLVYMLDETVDVEI
jgi:hypothetical protein